MEDPDPDPAAVADEEGPEAADVDRLAAASTPPVAALDDEAEDEDMLVAPEE